MSMRLMPKSDIVRAKALDRQREIDEGAKLARTVDNLRELTATEGAIFEKFRRETLANIHDETTKKAHERDVLKKEVSDLKDERLKLQKPLDAEWAKVNKEHETLDARREKIDEAERIIGDTTRNTGLIAKKTIATLARATSKESIADTRLQDADRDAKTAKLVFERVERLRTEATERSEKIGKELLHRDMMASSRERSVTLKEEAITKKEKLLETERLQLKDQRETLERAFKRLEKHHASK